jgi:hypothetical protein
MADQNRNPPNQNTSRGQQGQRGTEQGQRPSRDDESIGTGGRSDREPASTAEDRGMGESRRRNVDNIDELEDDAGIQSDVDEVDEGDRSNR